MSVWSDVVGQPEVTQALQNAVASGKPAHGWLITGPPGSGRSVAALAFAAALQCPHGGCGTCVVCSQVLQRTHPDVTVVSTEGMTLDIAKIRELVGIAQRHPGQSPWRVIMIEDADRMAERTWNVLLKSLEEPPPRTMWLLNAPSADDVLPTIRSRCHVLHLRIPAPDVVAEYLVRTEQVDPAQGLALAHIAQCHIGVARRLARDPKARERRATVTNLAVTVQGLGDAMRAAAQIHELAETEAADAATERNAAEREQLLRWLGVEPGKAVPPALRSQVKKLEDEQKRRVTRHQADVLDRVLTDIQSVYRDVLVTQLGAQVALVNADLTEPVYRLAQHTSAETTMTKLSAVAQTRRRVTGPVMLNRKLALEAMMVRLVATG